MTWTETGLWLRDNAPLLLPLLLSLVMAWGDIKTRRIPNYLTLGTAVAGLGFQLGCHGWWGLWSGFLGLLLGLGLLLPLYLLRGMGAGDVKALAALGAWLGPRDTFFLFLYMGISGGVLIILFLAWKGHLWSYIRRGFRFLRNLCFPQFASMNPAESPPPQLRLPYASALALGMLLLYLNGLKY